MNATEMMKRAKDAGHQMVKHDDCPCENCSCHWECKACGAMIVIMDGVTMESPGMKRDCGESLQMQ